MRARDVQISFNGEYVRVAEGLPLSVALYEKGYRVLGYSFKYGRPRGSTCFDWWEPLRVEVDGDPLANPSITPVRGGMEVRVVKPPYSGLRALASLMLKTGFQHGFLARSRVGWAVLNRLIKSSLPYPALPATREAGGGVIRSLSFDVTIIGGGLAGLTVAHELGGRGLRVGVLEARGFLGGRWRYAGDEPLRREIEELAGEIRDRGGEVLLNTVFIGVFDDGYLAVRLDDDVVYRIRSRYWVLATGARDVPIIFENNDLPGVMEGDAALRLAGLYGVLPGARGLVYGLTPWGVETSIRLRRAGVEVILSGETSMATDEEVERAESMGVEVLRGFRVVRAGGKWGVKTVTLEGGGERRTVRADFVAYALIRSPSFEVASQMGVKVFFHELGGFIPVHGLWGDTNVDNVFVAGEAGGLPPDPALIRSSARLAAHRILGGGGRGDEFERELGRTRPWLLKALRTPPSRPVVERYPTILKPSEKSFVCFCLDVTTSDVEESVERVLTRDIEKVKRDTGLGTGRCQGRRCMYNALLTLRRGGEIVGEPKFVTRPPIYPIRIAKLLGGEDAE